ncbi:MAG TPA: sugar transferase [Candidatus Saccharimonadia bacterium]|nr:sugar transferase [Candidatus Saccharimonadia bacterium]
MNYDAQKRILDLVVASFLAIAFLPVWIVVPILIMLDSSGPIIFTHRRVGKGGKTIYLYKFRSMVKDADEILHKKDKELLKEFKEGDWKLLNDPRVTRLGKILRALTIDEFPQLFNVFRGEMSMVGPRAYVQRELEEQQKKYPETKALISDITSVKPGITGPWQTSGRNEIPFNMRAKMDADYARQRSIKNDILILLRTPMAMISKW